jgi:hypothetical protein
MAQRHLIEIVILGVSLAGRGGGNNESTQAISKNLRRTEEGL